ncbi:MAG: MFS transporter [Anaerofustis sp.]
MKTNRNIRLMYAIALLQGMVFYAPIATLYRQNRGVGYFEIALIESISLVAMILLEIPWGLIADRVGYKQTMLFCNALYLLSKIIFWKASGFGMFLAERLLLSAVLAGLSGCDTAYLYGNAQESDIRKIYSLYGMYSTIGYISAALLFSVFMAQNDDLAAEMTVMSYAVAFVLTLFLGKAKPAFVPHQSVRNQLGDIFRSLRENKTVFPLLLSFAFLSESNLMITVFLSQAQYLRGGIGISAIALFAVFPALAGLCGGLGNHLAVKFGENRLMKWLFGIAAFACLIMGWSASPVFTVICMVFLRGAASVAQPIGMEIQNRFVSSASRASVLSVYSFIMNLSAAGMDLMFGSAAGISVSAGMLLGFFFCGAGLLFYSIRTKK